MKKKLFWVSLIYIYIYSVTPQNAYAIKDATSFNPKSVKVEAKNNSVPIGTVIVWTKDEIPEGWLECNGQAVNQDLYPDLFVLMHNTPNYQGYFLRGVGGNSDKLGVEQGDAIRDVNGQVDGILMGFAGQVNLNGVFKNSKLGNGTFHAFNMGGWTNHQSLLDFSFSGSVPTANENRPINKAVKYIIKAE